jgi:hypothetical protein
MSVVGLITNNTAYREEVGTLMAWCQVNNLSLNVSKTKEPIVDFSRNQAGQGPILINRAAWRHVITSNSSAYTTPRRLNGITAWSLHPLNIIYSDSTPMDIYLLIHYCQLHLSCYFYYNFNYFTSLVLHVGAQSLRFSLYM